MKQAIFLICSLCAIAMVVMAGGSGAFLPTAMGAPLPSQTVTAVPLYRLVHHQNRLHFYTTDANEREAAIKQHGYLDDNNIAGYVLPKPAHGTVALYRLSAVVLACKGTLGTAKFFFTTDKAAKNKAVAAGWHLDRVVGYVAPLDRGLPGTTPLYQMYNDLSECKKVSAIQVFNLPDRERAYARKGDDDFFYTTSDAEKEQAISLGYKSHGVTAYVWPAPVAVALHAPAAPLPDLTVRQVEAEESSVKAVVFNEGEANTGGAHLYAHLFIYDKAGKTLFSDGKWVGGMSPGQARPVKFETGGRSLVGLQYQIKLDIANQVKESNESNNVTETVAFRRKIKLNVDPNAASRVPAPSATITGVEATATQALPKRTSYRLTVSNWASYDAAWFQSLKNKLPAAPCGGSQTDARMLMRYSLIRNGSAVKVGCKPLNSPQDLKVGEVHSPQPLTDTDRLVVTLEDRADGAKYSSEPFAVGWFGIGDVLTTVGCKSFLGRSSSYLCTTDKGMAACENLKSKGKPIQCTRAGKKAN